MLWGMINGRLNEAQNYKMNSRVKLMKKIKRESKKWWKRRKEGEETLISFLEPSYTNKDLTLKANSNIKGMKIPCSETETQNRVGCTKKLHESRVGV